MSPFAIFGSQAQTRNSPSTVHSPEGLSVKFAITRISRLLLLLACATGAIGNASAAAEFKDFRDWHAACDNLRNCSAYGFQADEPASAYMRVERSGAASAPVKITIVAQVNDKTTVMLAFNDANLRGLPSGRIALK